MLANWIKQSTTTTGTGALALSTVTGYPPASSQLAVNERAAYVILDASDLPLERGVGYIDGSGDWVRDVVAATYSGGTYSGVNPSALSLASGSKSLIISPGAQTMLTSKQGVWANSNKVYGDVNLIGSTSNVTLTADRAYALAFSAAVDAAVDAVIFRVVTAGAAGKLARCGVYSVGSDGLPGVLLATGSSVAVDSTGVKASTFTAFRPPPVFITAILSDGAPAIFGAASGIVGSMAWGADSTLTPCSMIYHSGATGLVLPTTWTPVTNSPTAPRPSLYMRVT